MAPLEQQIEEMYGLAEKATHGHLTPLEAQWLEDWESHVHPQIQIERAKN